MATKNCIFEQLGVEGRLEKNECREAGLLVLIDGHMENRIESQKVFERGRCLINLCVSMSDTGYVP